MISGWLEQASHPQLLTRSRHNRRLRGAAARAKLVDLSLIPLPAQDSEVCGRADTARNAVPGGVPVSRCSEVVRYRDRFCLPARYVAHLVLCLLVCMLLLGEQFQSWSSWAVMPATSRAAATALRSEQSDSADKPVPVMVSREAVVQTGRSPEVVAPAVPVIPPEDNLVFPETHQLAPGETLGAVAARYGIPLETLIWSNGLETGDVPAIGQELRIPRVAGMPYVVREQDTVESIAARSGVSPDAIWLYKPNRLEPGEPLPVGRELFLPGATQPLPDTLLALYGGIEGLAASEARPAGVVRDAKTNMREGPDVAYARVAQLDAGRRARLLARHENWLKVEVAGTSGWLRADLLDVSGDLVAALPETDDFPPLPPVWVWPTYGTTTSPFGPRWGGFHNGLDIANRAWTPIVAARAGTVVEAGWCRGYGYCVKINHGGGVQTVYGHLIDQPVVASGEEVAVGQLIGRMGSTYDARGGGYSTGVHLHFEVRVNGRAVNPFGFLP